jgi:hypothetical protein
LKLWHTTALVERYLEITAPSRALSRLCRNGAAIVVDTPSPRRPRRRSYVNGMEMVTPESSHPNPRR